MPPRTNSPPPSSYETYDDTTTSLSHNSRPLTNSNNLPSQKNYFSYSSPSPSSSSTSSAKNVDIARIKNRDSIGDDDSSNSIINDNNDRENLNTPFISPFNITGRVFSSTALQIFSLIMTYSFCITTIWMIFCTSYLLTIYDDTRRMLRTSRVWARVKDGVRERIAMMGDDWEDFLQKHFDQHDGVDRNNNGHLGGGLNSSNNDSGYNNNHSDKNTNWLNAMFEFMTTVSGQNIADKFKQ